jgi:hypothetical protein
VKFNEYGLFEGDGSPFETVAEWDDWQEKFIRQVAQNAGDEPIFEDSGQSLWRIGTDHSESLVTAGTLKLSRDRFVLGDFSIPLGAIYQMGVYGPDHIVFSAEGVNYEIKSEIVRSGRKYESMYAILTRASVRNAANS